MPIHCSDENQTMDFQIQQYGESCPTDPKICPHSQLANLDSFSAVLFSIFSFLALAGIYLLFDKSEKRLQEHQLAITKVLEDNKLVGEIPEDLTALIKRQIKIMKHREFHKKDQTSKRGLILTESKIHRLVKYYKKTGRLPKEWKYDSSKARLVIG